MKPSKGYKRVLPEDKTDMGWPMALTGPRLFKNEEVLSIDYVPERLPHREEQLRTLFRIFGPTLEKPGSMARRVLITGEIGTGKTVTAKKFGQLIAIEARRRGLNFYYVHVNCRKERGSFTRVLLRALRMLEPRAPDRGFATNELLSRLLDLLDERDAYMIITLDDMEVLIDKCGSDPFYDLSRAHDDRLEGPFRLSLICILRDPGKLAELDMTTRSTLEEYIIHMPRYTKEQLVDILMDRVRLAFYEGAVRTHIVDFIADISAERGDARYAIELLWRAGKLAELEGRSEIMAEHVRKAVVQVWPIPREVIEVLNLHAKLFLLALARTFRFTDEAYIPMGEAEDAYRVVCEEYGQEPRKHTQVWKYVQELSELQIISTRPSGPGRRGRTTLISLRSIPAEDLEEELTKALAVELGLEPA